jgi:methionine-rich copper-binding protein CopC
MLGTLAWAPAAFAHDELLDLQPGNKVVVTAAPTEVQLVFGAPVLALGTKIRVTGPAGKVVSTGQVTVDQGTVVQKLTGGLVDGVYRVDWRVTASDGHPVSGGYTFSLRAAATASPSPVTSTTSATVTAGASASASPSSTSPAPSASAGTSGVTSSGSGLSTGLVVGLSVIAAVVAGTAFTLVRRRNGASVSNEGNQQK